MCVCGSAFCGVGCVFLLCSESLFCRSAVAVSRATFTSLAF